MENNTVIQQEIVKSIKDAIDFADLLVIDTCSWVDVHGPLSQFSFRILDTTLRQSGKHVAVPQEVYEELKKLCKQPEKDDTVRTWAKVAVQMIKAKHFAAGSAKTLQIYGCDKLKSHADARILSVFDEFYPEYDILVLTQDRDLAMDLLSRAQTRSVKHKSARILYVDKVGVWRPCKPVNDGLEPHPFAWGRNVSDLSREERVLFPESTECPLTDGHGRSITLGKRLGSGGEGIVYTVDDKRVAKLYKAISPMRDAKLRRMIANPPPSAEGLAYPTDIILDEQRTTLGCLLPRAQGKSLHDILRIDAATMKPAILRECPHFQRHHIVEIALAIVRHVQSLHRHGVILGDLNQDNILVELPKDEQSSVKVWLVDLDSAQVEDFPSLVQKEDFVAPWKIAEQKIEQLKLKKIEDDGFALAVLLFLILMTETMPYQCRNLEYTEAARDGLFPYATPKTRRKWLPPNQLLAQFRWEEFPVELRGRFCAIFDKKGYWFKRQSTPEPSTWLPLLLTYRDFLLTSKTIDAFEFGQGDILKCKECGITYIDSTGTLQQYCPICRSKTRTCNKCGAKEPTTWEGEIFYCTSCKKNHQQKKETRVVDWRISPFTQSSIDSIDSESSDAFVSGGHLLYEEHKTGKYNPDFNPIYD